MTQPATDDHHRCLSGSHCRNPTHNPATGTEQPATTTKPDTICEPCRHHIHTTITDSPTVWDNLHAAIGDRSMRAPTQSRVSGTKTPPIPIDVDIDATKDALAEWLIAAAARIAEHLNTDDPQPRSRTDQEQRRIINTCTALIDPHINVLIDSGPDTLTVWRKTGESVTHIDKTGIDIAHEILRIHRTAHAILGDHHIHQSLQLPCPNCHARRCTRTVTTRRNGNNDDHIYCTACQSHWPYDIYQFRCRRDADDIEEATIDANERHQYQTAIDLEHQHRCVAEWLAAERAHQLQQIATFAGHNTAAELLATINNA